ncbi:Uncharacterised protein [Anaerostipes hadrus]|uniref:Uncharacterized protein n=1 Tax=Anaerostipes hadrus TaxID=649756 RepID=A0A174UU57_ANAHA|nr:hypothetical protein [Anaerostipes hadrus]CUQ23235.1 Uncharacterised protein [Anaerostipes hadrus]
MNYIDKMMYMLKEGYTFEEITENLYLNYSAVVDVDEVYRIRKKISEKYGCNLNDVKLIGSSHTGYTYKNKKLQIRKNPKDYDFGIIGSEIFIKYFHKVKIENITLKNKQSYINNIMKGKLHPKYTDKNFLDELEETNEKIQNELKVKRHITICFYMSEYDFINGLVQYSKQLYGAKLKEMEKESTPIKMEANTVIEQIEKMEE